jgi:hypothetical protein
MTAVMLDHEQTYEKAGGGNSDKERSPRLVQPELALWDETHRRLVSFHDAEAPS